MKSLLLLMSLFLMSTFSYGGGGQGPGNPTAQNPVEGLWQQFTRSYAAQNILFKNLPLQTPMYFHSTVHTSSITIPNGLQILVGEADLHLDNTYSGRPYLQRRLQRHGSLDRTLKLNDGRAYFVSAQRRIPAVTITNVFNQNGRIVTRAYPETAVTFETDLVSQDGAQHLTLTCRIVNRNLRLPTALTEYGSSTAMEYCDHAKNDPDCYPASLGPATVSSCPLHEMKGILFPGVKLAD